MDSGVSKTAKASGFRLHSRCREYTCRCRKSSVAIKAARCIDRDKLRMSATRH